ncbi:enoyl-CoA hydratase/isomerase (macronuclear) [Tetrahymena thermophila SB210]|uniref:Enoyl-CoA hydratase/isomerase n=1 Tax=Tetrahymena thermophila (strain SB210) TaxID=312017 RepID=Q22MM1_TETTS|nr:enoyl-CoA hydratase/isomerase [Tetrahymena thermophila SB210]EAR86651.2 enoyl-CoA hydratase/isomerase [Tetrahymena thermophila SB210]|eukprot:XP_976999.2 enoyl-CoA hydratase/isomerase [Tetrahymena thermophila SB210]
MYQNIEVKKIENNKIVVININRPQKRNCVNSETAQELLKAFQDFDNDPQALIAIFASKDGIFCAGFDLMEASQIMHPSKIQEMFPLHFQSKAPMGISRYLTKKPVIGSIEGFAVAGGLELSLWCDMVVSNRQCVFGVFCRRFGVPLIDGGTVRLQRVIGFNRAKDMVLTGREVKGQEAYEWGLVNRLCSDNESVLEKSIELCKEIIRNPQYCMQLDRQSLYENTFINFDQQIQTEFHRGSLAILKGETSQGASNFVNNKAGRGGKPLPKL